MGRHLALLSFLALVLAVPALGAFDPAYEQQNYSKIDERAKRDAADTEFQTLLRQKGLDPRQAITVET